MSNSLAVIRQIAVAQAAPPVGSRSPDTAAAAAAEVARPFEAADQFTQPSQPSRFPWLSRLSTQLSLASKIEPKFPDAAALGDQLDTSA